MQQSLKATGFYMEPFKDLFCCVGKHWTVLDSVRRSKGMVTVCPESSPRSHRFHGTLRRCSPNRNKNSALLIGYVVQHMKSRRNGYFNSSRLDLLRVNGSNTQLEWYDSSNCCSDVRACRQWKGLKSWSDRLFPGTHPK